MQLDSHGNAYPAHRLFKTLNKYCEKNNVSLIINHIEAVPSTFHARYSSLSREYLYRIGVTDKEIYPAIEWRKCYFVKRPFCVDKATETCQVFQGTKDFSSFCHGLQNQPPGYPTVRALDTFRIETGRPLLDPKYDPSYSGVTFYDFHIKARSFMYKQVRRMVSVVVSVAQNRMTLDEACQLFEKPGKWNSKALTAPSYGLYLLHIDYKIPQDEQPERSVAEQGAALASSNDTNNSTNWTSVA